jgi:polyhydroxyalkanoate synthesis repressor PhaR
MASRTTNEAAPIIIKKYANRRLYNTDASAYVTLDDLRVLVREGVLFVVQDAKTGEDLTRSVLTQILVEAEQGEESLLPIGFLRQLIGMYGDSMGGWMMPQYLDCMTQWFEQHQDEMQRNMPHSLSAGFPVNAPLEAMKEAAEKNMAAFNQAMQAFWPQFQQPEAAKPDPTPAKTNDEGGLDSLREQLEAMQRQLDKMGKS